MPVVFSYISNSVRYRYYIRYSHKNGDNSAKKVWSATMNPQLATWWTQKELKMVTEFLMIYYPEAIPVDEETMTIIRMMES